MDKRPPTSVASPDALATRSGIIISVVGLSDKALRTPSQMQVTGRNEGLRGWRVTLEVDMRNCYRPTTSPPWRSARP